jgi:hypothetical protein
MGAHKQYNKFRSAVELLEAVGFEEVNGESQTGTSSTVSVEPGQGDEMRVHMHQYMYHSKRYRKNFALVFSSDFYSHFSQSSLKFWCLGKQSKAISFVKKMLKNYHCNVTRGKQRGRSSDQRMHQSCNPAHTVSATSVVVVSCVRNGGNLQFREMRNGNSRVEKVSGVRVPANRVPNQVVLVHTQPIPR